MDSEIEEFGLDSVAKSATGHRLRVSLIGDFRAETMDGQSLLPVSRKARALLCIIAIARPQGALRAVAGALLWSSKHRDAVANSLRQALGELRPLSIACGRPFLLSTKRGRLVLDPDAAWIDVLDMSAEEAAAIDHADPANTLCRDLRGVSSTFDDYLDRLWVEIGFRRALAPAKNGRLGSARDSVQVNRHAEQINGRLPLDPSKLFGQPVVAGFNFEKLERFPSTLSDAADIASHQLGWRMAVLPFRSLGAPLGRGIALGMAEEVSAALGRFRAPRLVATATFWDGEGPANDAMSRCRTYHLDYIIDGTIQVVEKKVRVTVTLLDVVLDFEVVWSQRFDGSLDDLFSLQDRIASETVAQVDPELYQRRWATISQPKTKIAEAHQAVLSAIQGIYRLERSRFLRARDLLAQAIELDPDFAAAHAWLAYWCIIAVAQGWNEPGVDVITEAGLAADRAVLHDPRDARALAIAGHVKAYLMHDVKSALALHARAIELNPNLTTAWSMSALSKIYSGDHVAGLRHAQIAQSLSPRDPHSILFEQAFMMGHLFRRELDEGDEIASGVIDRHPEHRSALRVYLGILGHLGRKDDARSVLERLTRIAPDTSVQSIIARPPLRPDDLAYYARGLRLAGLREE